MSIDSIKVGDIFRIKKECKKVEYTSKSEKFITNTSEEVRLDVGRIIGTPSVAIDPKALVEYDFIAAYTYNLNARFNKRIKLFTRKPFHPEIVGQPYSILVDDRSILEKIGREVDYRSLPETTEKEPINGWGVFGHENINGFRYLRNVVGKETQAQLDFVRTHTHLPAIRDLGKFWILKGLDEFVCVCGNRLDSQKTKIKPISSVYITKIRKTLASMVRGGFFLDDGVRAKLLPHILVCHKCNNFSVVVVESNEDGLYFTGAYIGPLEEYKKPAKKKRG